MNLICMEEIMEIENHIRELYSEMERARSEYICKLKKASERKIQIFSQETGIISGSKLLLSGSLDGVHIVTEIRYVVHDSLGAEVGFTVMEMGRKGKPIGRGRDVIIHSNPSCDHYNKVFILQILERKK